MPLVARVLHSTANITSVSKRYTPASTGCATIIIVVGALSLFSTLIALLSAGDGNPGLVMISALVLIAGILIFRLQKPTYHVVFASSSGERQGLTSQDEQLVDRVIAAITEAIIYRG